MMLWQKTGSLYVIATCLAAVGCSSGRSPEEPDPTRNNLLNIGAAYTRANFQLNRGPANMHEFLPFVKKQGDSDKILRSPNDGELFEIVWGVELRQLKAKGNDLPIVAFEKRGKDGVRWVLRGREVLPLSEGELRSGTFPPGYTLRF